MKTGLPLNELANRITSDRSGNKDYLGDTRHFRMTDTADLYLNGGTELNFSLRQIAHEQIAEKVGIPFKYYERMRITQPALLATNVNRWFAAEPAKRLLRTNTGSIRAFLSDGYRPLDNFDVAENLIPKLISSGLEVVSSQITESRLYIQAKTARLTGDVKVGDTVQAGIVISNSEVGRGSLALSKFWYRLACLNGMVGENLVRQAHVGGSRKGDITLAEETFTSETRKATDKAFWMQARDTVDALLSPERFNRRLDDMKRAALVKIADPVTAVAKVVELLDLNQSEGNGVLAALASGGDLSLWGMANAVTAQAHEAADYDRGFEFEQFGRKILELPAATFAKN